LLLLKTNEILSGAIYVQENLLELKEDKQRAEMDLKEVTKENESLKGPLAEARNTVEELTQKMENYHKDKQRLMVGVIVN
jgi:chromosome segregation ATPase